MTPPLTSRRPSSVSFSWRLVLPESLPHAVYCYGVSIASGRFLTRDVPFVASSSRRLARGAPHVASCMPPRRRLAMPLVASRVQRIAYPWENSCSLSGGVLRATSPAPPPALHACLARYWKASCGGISHAAARHLTGPLTVSRASLGSVSHARR